MGKSDRSTVLWGIQLCTLERSASRVGVLQATTSSWNYNLFQTGGKEEHHATGLTWEDFWKRREKGQRPVPGDKSGEGEREVERQIDGNVVNVHRGCS